MEALRQVEEWPVGAVAVGITDATAEAGTTGDRAATFPWASVTKLLTALAALVAAEEGVVELDERVGPPGSTVRHLLAHASGLPPEGEAPIAQPGTRRIYSNAGFEVLAKVIEDRAEMLFPDYLHAAVLEPLGLAASLDGSPASGAYGTLDDLLALGRELLAPRLISPETLAEATEVAFPGLTGVLPGFGWSRTTGGSASSSATRNARTGRVPGTRRARSGTSGRAAASSGSIPRLGSRAPVCATRPSGSGRKKPGRGSRTLFSPSSAQPAQGSNDSGILT